MVLATLAALAPPVAAEPKLGISADAGVPDGASASIVFRPVSRIRLHAGATHNLVSRGERVGISVSPFRSWFTPTLNLDAGRYRDGDANVLVRMVTGDETFSSPVLERFGYRYANAHLGFEFGRERVTFYLHGGASYISTRLRNLDATSEDGSTSVTFTSDPSANVVTVSARLGLIVYFL
jgi:hypothetical protein